MFIDKKEILKDVFKPIKIIKDSELTGYKQTTGILKSMLYTKEHMSVTLAYTGYETKYYTDDELYKEFGDTLPDNVDGEVILFYNVEDACRLLEVS